MKTKSSQIVGRSLLIAAVAAMGLSIRSLMGADAPTTAPATMPAGQQHARTTPTAADAERLRPQVDQILKAPAVGKSVADKEAALPTTKPVSTAAPRPGQTPADIDRLINQLGSDSATDRDAAEKKLEDAGAVAIPALRKAAEENNDPEVRSRAADALAQMKDRGTSDGTLITLHMKDATATDVLSAISKQAQAQITSNGTGRIAGVDNRTLTVDADNKPFWDVMADVCGQLSICPALDVSGRGQLRLGVPMSNQRNWTQSPHQIVGPFWVSVASVYRARTIDLQGPPDIDDQFGVRMIIYPEPKLAVAQVSNLVLKEATDNAGHSLLPKPLPAGAALGNALMMRSVTMSMGGMNLGNRTVESRLNYPEHAGDKIALLKGEVDVLISGDIQQYVVDDVLGTQKITNPLKNCTVQASVTRNGNSTTYIATVTCNREGLSDDQWSAMVNRSNDITLEDADGHALTTYSRMPMSTDTTFKSTGYFSTNPMMGAAMIRVGGGIAPVPAGQKIGEPKKLIWSVATSLKSMKVPVMFKDLPMP